MCVADIEHTKIIYIMLLKGKSEAGETQAINIIKHIINIFQRTEYAKPFNSLMYNIFIALKFAFKERQYVKWVQIDIYIYIHARRYAASDLR